MRWALAFRSLDSTTEGSVDGPARIEGHPLDETQGPQSVNTQYVQYTADGLIYTGTRVIMHTENIIM